MPAVRDGCLAIPFLRREDEPLRVSEEDRKVRVSSRAGQYLLVDGNHHIEHILISQQAFQLRLLISSCICSDVGKVGFSRSLLDLTANRFQRFDAARTLEVAEQMHSHFQRACSKNRPTQQSSTDSNGAS